MKTSKEKLEKNDWYVYDETDEEIYCGKFIDDEYVSCFFKKSTSEIFCVDISSKYLSPEFIEELNKELKKLEEK